MIIFSLFFCLGKASSKIVVNLCSIISPSSSLRTLGDDMTRFFTPKTNYLFIFVSPITTIMLAPIIIVCGTFVLILVGGAFILMIEVGEIGIRTIIIWSWVCVRIMVKISWVVVVLVCIASLDIWSYVWACIVIASKCIFLYIFIELSITLWSKAHFNSFLICFIKSNFHHKRINNFPLFGSYPYNLA